MGTASVTASPRSFPSHLSSAVIARRILRLAAEIYAGLVVYGSLLPFDFHARPFTEATRAFAQGGIFDHSRTDLATNVAVFLPMSLLWASAIPNGRSGRGAWWRVILVMGRCVGLSAAIEFIQLWLPNRSSSLGDLAANAIGVLLGFLLWLIVDPWMRQGLEGLIEDHIGEPRQGPWRGTMALAMLSIYGVMLAALAGWFTHRMVGWSEALARLRALHLLPLYYHQQASIFVAVPSAIVVACTYFPVGLLRRVVGRSGKPLSVVNDVGMTALWAAGIAALVEASKLFLDGKRADTGNILIAVLAAASGYLLAPRLLRRYARRPSA